MSVAVYSHPHRVAVPCGCVLGEGPVWDARSGTLFWVDIEGEALWQWRPGSGEEAHSRRTGERVGFLALTAEEDVVILGLASGLARLSLSGGAPEMVLRPEPGLPGNRINDGGAGPDGSLYFGTMDLALKDEVGSFYRWSSVGLAPFGEKAVVTNGPAVDGARRLVYAADTLRGRVYRHKLEADGTPGEREDFVTFRSGDGHPDGIAVDAEGHVWICHFGGARITRFTPEGAPSLIVPMPTAQVTKVAFGGPDLSTIFVTTAAWGRDRETDPLAGHLFAIEAGIAGCPPEFCRMGL